MNKRSALALTAGIVSLLVFGWWQSRAQGGASEDEARNPAKQVVEDVDIAEALYKRGELDESAAMHAAKARSCVNLGRFECSLNHFQREAEIHAERKDDQARAIALMSAANVASRLRLREQTFSLYAEAERLFQNVDHGRALLMLELNRGLAYDLLGEDRKAIASMKRVLERAPAAAKSYGEAFMRPGVMKAHQNLGMLHAQQGDIARARKHFGESLSMRSEHGDPRGYANTLAALGRLDITSGDYGRAKRRLLRAREIQRQHGFVLHAAQSVRELGVLAWRLRDLSQARSYVMVAKRELVGASAPSELLAIDLDLANIDIADGNKSDELVSRLTSIAARAQAINDVEQEMVVRGNVADLMLKSDRFDLAAQLATENLARSRKLRLRMDELVALLTLAGAQHAKDDHRASIQSLTRAHALATELHNPRMIVAALRGRATAQLSQGDHAGAIASVHEAVPYLDDRSNDLAPLDVIRVRDSDQSVLDLGMRAAFASKNADAFFRFAEEGRARVLLNSLARHHRVPAHESHGDAHARYKHDAAIRRARRRLLQAFESNAMPEVEAARQALHEAVAVRRSALRGGRTFKPRVKRLREARRLLPAHRAWMSIHVFDDTVLALVVSGKHARLVTLGAVEKLNAAQRAFAEQEHPNAWNVLRDTYRTRFDAALALDPVTTHIYVSTTGVTAHMPIAEYLGRRTVSIVPSFAILQELLARKRVGGRRVVALADPDYSADTSLARLRASGDEARAIGTKVHVRASATEEAYRRAASEKPGWRAIHIAAHGDLDDYVPQRSALRLSPSGHDDGRLTMEEIERIPIRTDLVVLSACQSGIGQLSRSEGSLSLARGFLSAGARAVIASLWPVDDQATQAFMTAFYRRWNPKQGAGEPLMQALRRAKQELASSAAFRDPDHWAGWQVWGVPHPGETNTGETK